MFNTIIGVVQRWNKHLLYKEEGLWIFARNWDYIINRNCSEIFSRASILNIMGQLVIAILIGMVWRAAIGVPHDAIAGTNFASKKLRFWDHLTWNAIKSC